MASCDLEVRFDREDRTYRPGEPVRGEVVVVTDEEVSCKGLKVELLWETHGAGNTDRKVLDTLRLEPQQWRAGLPYRHPFAFTAPSGPLTYHGHHLHVDHYVRARVDLPWALDPKAREPYRLAPGPSSRQEHLAAPVDFTVPAPGATAGPVAKAIGWLLLPVLVVLVGGLLLMLLPLVLVVGGAVLLRRHLAERRLGRVTVEVVAPEVGPRPTTGVWAVARLPAGFRSPSPRAIAAGEPVRFTVRYTPRSRVDVDRVAVALLATERCRSGSGKNARTHSHTLCDERSVLAEGLSCSPGAPVHLAGELPVPDLEAYSFKAHHNSLEWKLVVTVEIPRWPDWKQDQPLVLIPGDPTAAPRRRRPDTSWGEDSHS